jgi:hypothetical protein
MYRKTFAKATFLVSWQSVESVGAGQTGDGCVEDCQEQSTIVETGDRQSALRLKLLSQSCAGPGADAGTEDESVVLAE